MKETIAREAFKISSDERNKLIAALKDAAGSPILIDAMRVRRDRFGLMDGFSVYVDLVRSDGKVVAENGLDIEKLKGDGRVKVTDYR